MLTSLLYEMVPLLPTENPGVGEAPASHWNCVVGGVRMHPRPSPSVKPERCQRKISRIGQHVRTSVWAYTKLARREVPATNSCLPI